MKKTLLATAIALGFAAPVWATGGADITAQVNVGIEAAVVDDNYTTNIGILNFGNNNSLSGQVLENQNGMSQVSQNSGINNLAQQSTNVNANTDGGKEAKFDLGVAVNASVLLGSVSGNSTFNLAALDYSNNNTIDNHVLQYQNGISQVSQNSGINNAAQQSVNVNANTDCGCRK